jgi:hypothetical protein
MSELRFFISLANETVLAPREGEVDQLIIDFP